MAGSGRYPLSSAPLAWSERRKLLASDGAGGDRFGTSLSLSGDTALVGAWLDGDMGSDLGSAYVFALRLIGAQPCADDDGCTSKFCVDSVCCESACDGSCEICNVAGLEGVCALTGRGSAPAPSCGGHLSNGVIGECATDCAGDQYCAIAYHCPNALGCVPKETDGKSCAGNNVCLSGHCVDGVCCAEACGAYRCGSGGTCEVACSSSGQCATGHECNSERKCEPASSGAANESGSCHLASVSAATGRGQLRWRWFGGLAVLVGLGLSRRRRHAMAVRKPNAD